MNRIPLRQLTGLLVGFILLCCMGDLQAIPRGKMFSGSEQRVLQVELHMKDQPLKSVFNEIQRQTDYTFVYNNSLVDVNRKVSIDVKADLKEVLHQLLSGLKLSFQIIGEQIIISPSSFKTKSPQEEEKNWVRGVVYSESDGSPLPGVVIRSKTTPAAVTTDVDGRFEIEEAVGGILVFSFLGMETLEVQIDDESELVIRLKEELTELDEVIVTGYQTISRERAAGSFTVINQKDIQHKLQTGIMNRLEGMVAGLTSYKGKLQIRGTSTISGNETPLYVVDGVPYEGSLEAINPSDIVNVTLLKDASAASIYGARSANGVIVITTRSGADAPTRVSYNGSIKLTPLPDTDYYNLMSSSEFVDFQQELFNLNPGTRPAGYYVNEVRDLLFDRKENLISEEELEKQLNVYRERDRRQQVIDEFLRVPAIVHQHNLSVYGGVKKYNYALSFNYMKNLPYEKAQSDERIGFNLKNTFHFFDWLKADLGVLGSLKRADYDNGFSGMSVLTGSSKASYLLLKDEEGNQLPWYQAKSQGELDRLNGLGLLDESYYPLEELHKQRYESKDSYLNLNLNLNLKIIEGLTLDLRYQQDFGFVYTKNLYDKDSWFVRNMVNNATQIIDNEIVQNIPVGGQIIENRGDRDSYTLRGQLNFNKVYKDKHSISVIAGAERRAVKNSSTKTYKVGYDDHSLSYKVLDEKLLGKTLTGTEALGGQFTYNSQGQGFHFAENRYVSFYGNASYTFDDKLSLTASMRIDQSNLFGTDPKYQYRPLWSVGAQYRLLGPEQVSWIDRLAFRATYGINGNVAKMSGPFLTVSDGGVNGWINDYSSYVTYPPNSGLRWEKTAVVNIGVDFDLLQSRLGGSIEFYNKNTTDLLYNKTGDPTYGWNSLMVNYGDMYNRGVEIHLNTVNIAVKDFVWKSMLNFSYNKNKLTRIENTRNDAIYYVNGGQIREGRPMNSLYSVRWAGLDEQGQPQAYDKDGNIVKSFADLKTEDLVYSGVTTPPYAASLSNSLQYKGISLSLLFTYYGGHVMRGVFGQYLVGTGYSTNMDKLSANFWRKPGDENNPETTPAFKQSANANIQNLWKAADKHIQKADYIKLNEIILAYQLPAKWIKNTFIKEMNMTFQVQNVWKWVANDQGLDPEAWTGITLSPSRGEKEPVNYTFGLALHF